MKLTKNNSVLFSNGQERGREKARGCKGWGYRPSISWPKNISWVPSGHCRRQGHTEPLILSFLLVTITNTSSRPSHLSTPQCHLRATFCPWTQRSLLPPPVGGRQKVPAWSASILGGDMRSPSQVALSLLSTSLFLTLIFLLQSLKSPGQN